MKKFLKTDTRELTYVFERKNIKNINLRIRENGNVYVSAPLNVSEKAIEKFILSHLEWIFSHLDKLENLNTEDIFCLKDGGNITLFGKKYTLDIQNGNNDFCGLEGDRVILSLPEPSNTDSVKKSLRSLMEHLLNETILTVCLDVYEKHFKKVGIPYPEIRTRKMKARWGSCYVQNNVIILNKALVFVPKKCIEYVICHEFTHFIYADHSSDFYKTLEGYFPSWKDCRKQLREYSHVTNNNFL